MTTSKNRRQFIFTGLGLSTASLFGGWWFFKVRNRDIHPTINAIIRQELHYLQITDEDLKKFSEELKNAMLLSDLTLASWSGLLAPIYGNSKFLDYFSSTQGLKKQFAEYICTEFLLSSDFFQNGANTKKPVRYLKYYYLNLDACNPLARF